MKTRTKSQPPVVRPREETLAELASEVVGHIKNRDYGRAESRAELLHSRLVLHEAGME